MKISIIGGGPAGLYLACALKKMTPSAELNVYEVRNESINSLGLGYTLQQLNTSLLERLDPNYYDSLFTDTPSPPITQALFKTNNDERYLKFSDGFSITRFELMRYLRKLADSYEVNVTEQKIELQDLDSLRKDSDLLVGADGLNSIVREKYAHQMQAKSHTAGTCYSWFTNESSQKRSEACFYAFQAPEGVIMLTSYPLTDYKQVVIIEMSKKCVNSGKFKGQSPEQCQDYLSSILSQNGDLISLKSAGLPWYSFRMNTTHNLAYENATLVGDAAASFHFCTGQGVTSAFTMAYTLSQCISKSSSMNTALEHYTKTVNLMYQKPTARSISNIHWFENIDEFFENTPKEHWLDLFIQKAEFKKTAVD